MFKTRLITAVALLGLFVAVLLYGGEMGWNVFVLLVLVGAYWEWARLGRFQTSNSLAYTVLGGVLCLAGSQWLNVSSQGFPLLALACVFWLAYVPWCLRTMSLGALSNKKIHALTGLVVISAAGLALVLAKSHGFVFVLSVLAICFVADIAAYVFGKTFGRHKLAPYVSPGKTWEGAVGGVSSVILMSWLLVGLTPFFPALQNTWQVVALERWHPFVFSFWLLVLSAYSVVGDLFESFLKRKAGCKDSGQLLPGHGGVLDRIDAQLPTLPLAMLLVNPVLN